jgi:hypothetical protein
VTGFTIGHDLHNRNAITPFFAKRHVQAVEPDIQDEVERLCQRIKEHFGSKKPWNLSVASLALSILPMIDLDHINDFASPRY